MKAFRLIALSPQGMLDPAIAIAASRADALGVLDLSCVQYGEAASAALLKLTRYARLPCGVRLGNAATDALPFLSAHLTEKVKTVVLSDSDPLILKSLIESLRGLGLTVLKEVKCVDEALAASKAGVDGLIAKGNEAGGWVGEETTFILLQRLLPQVSLPVFAQGGIGLHTAPACYAAGAAGVVLDWQLGLTRESLLPQKLKARLARMDGTEAVCLGEELGSAVRVFAQPESPAIRELQELLQYLMGDPRPEPEIQATWGAAVHKLAASEDPDRKLWLLGQDAAFAPSLARRFRTVGGVLEGIRQSVETHVRSAKALKPLDEGSPLALSHGTRYPIVQGPMSRVSDRAPFAAKVADEGGLPFLALGLLGSAELKPVLEETEALLKGRPWGVGMLGFAPHELRREQSELVGLHRPAFALIGGGRPDQAKAMERDGIRTYLHVPSPELLKMFIEDGARRFIFEGRECGGHIGPRSSFVLWSLMIDTLLEALPNHEAETCHVLFAGGIHDALSSSMVSCLAAPLAERGVKVGVLLGTAYLFTEEAVATGAIVEGFQKQAIGCLRTTILESGSGHASRCAATPYVEAFREEKKRLAHEKKSADEIRQTLDKLNMGRLRVASRGVRRHPEYGRNPKAPMLVNLSEEEQYSQGMYMIGQLAALRDRICTIDSLHRDISQGSSRRLSDLDVPELSALSLTLSQPSCASDIAIIGMACLAPGAGDVKTLWENILNRVNAITEIPEDRWDWRIYYDPDPSARDKVYSKWGGFLDAVPFDPLRYGIEPDEIRCIEPLQLLTLVTVSAALENAGYDKRPFNRERTSVIMGVNSTMQDLGQQYVIRSALPYLLNQDFPQLLDWLPEWTEKSFAGMLSNMTAGRVASHFQLGGVNYTIDAACAASLPAVRVAIRELENHTSDLVILGGADTFQSPYAYFCFSKTNALSPTGRCIPFDENADGTVIGEGVAALILKRREDAERDGDRIYALIRAVGASSDGRAMGLSAPRPEGQVLALERAYAKAGFSPATVGLIEAHGTGTAAGDRSEIESLKRVFEAADTLPRSCAVGSIKSMVGHTKAAAGLFGMIKAALALYHKVLPPTMGVSKPSPSLEDSSFFVCTEPRPWDCGNGEHRRAGVSSFGFGGTNFHVVMEESMRGSQCQVEEEGLRKNLHGSKDVRPFDVRYPNEGTKEDPLSPTIWMVNGGRAWPVGEVEAGAGRGHPARDSRVDLGDRLAMPEEPKKFEETSRLHRLRLQDRADTAASPRGNAAEAIMLEHQKMMRRFLEVQQEVMVKYLGNDTRASIGLAPEVRDISKAESRHHEFSTSLRSGMTDELRAELPHFLLTAVDAPPPNGPPLQLPSEGVVLITDDDSGIATQMAAELRALGGRVALVHLGDQVAEMESGVYAADLRNREAVVALLALIRKRQGQLAGIVHLAPLRKGIPFEEMTLADWKQRLGSDVKGLFNLAALASKDIREASYSGTAWLVAATAMGGSFGVDLTDHRPFFPGHGAVVGLVKTLAREWPHVRCKAVDFDRESDPEDVKTHLLREMAGVDREVEVGYQSSRRLILRLSRAAAFSDTDPPAAVLDSDSVVVLTGGARGVTAEVSIELAHRYHPTLILAGRSPLPKEEDPETVGLHSPKELKAALIARLRQKGGKVTPARIESDYMTLVQEREIRKNLAAIRTSGARVIYCQVDVRDEQSFGDFLDSVYGSHGRLDVFVHGAGVIEDKLVEDKADDAFSRVFDTKADSAFILSRKLKGESLKSLVFFSSLAARFGNRGQSDYAAANEVLNKMAVYLDRQWTGRVSALNWGPWAETGIASPEVQKQFQELGIELVEPRAGRRLVDRVVHHGRKGQVEILIGKGPWESEYTVEPPAPSGRKPAGNTFPLLQERVWYSDGSDAREITLRLDPSRDRYLDDHRLDGKPVFPFAMAMELIAEVAQVGWPDYQFASIHDLRMFRGIVVGNDGCELHVTARPKTAQNEMMKEVEVEIRSKDGPNIPNYRGWVRLEKQLAPPTALDTQMPSQLSPFPASVEDAYRSWLFHGPSLQGILKIDGVNGQAIAATIQPSSPAGCFYREVSGQWLVDPVIIDSAFQLTLLWLRRNFDMMCLPAAIDGYQRFRPWDGLPQRCLLSARFDQESQISFFDFQFCDADGGVIAVLQKLQAPSSKAFNRLAGTARRNP
jgi:3-oxoacyl-(acyl-carrier-protein) synthase/NAD(P)H-dependent flavin oxidoreductase YrpB (nitropropane dioxygenase family)/NAD(P)-dependent dehydrogenase (short-subunit alcohol dehydrogenase family)